MQHHTPTDIAKKIETIAQDFERKLYSTGGNLSLKKCFWYLIDWIWDDAGNAQMRKIEQGKADISLTQGNFNKKYRIKREEVDTAIRTIGVRVNPKGDNVIEYQYRYKYTMQWTNMIRTSSLTKTEALRAYRTVLLPSITYPLGAIYFSPHQCDSLQNLAAQQYLPKLGFNRKLPKSIL